MVTASYLNPAETSKKSGRTSSFFSAGSAESFFKPALASVPGSQRSNSTDGIKVYPKEDKTSDRMDPVEKATFIKENCIGITPDPIKAACAFDSYQETVVRTAKNYALYKCNQSILALEIAKPEEIDNLVKLIFHVDHIPNTLIKKAIISVRDQLEKTPILCKTCFDRACSVSAAIAFTPDDHTYLGICPSFFSKHNLTSTSRFLIHEGCHLANLDEENRFNRVGEFYCNMEKEKFNYFTAPCPIDIDNIHNADAWSYFIERLSYSA